MRGGFVGAKCANQGKPIKFHVHFIDGAAWRAEFRSEFKDEQSCSLCLTDVYPVFQITHENCSSLSIDITEGCLQKINEKEQEHYKLHIKDMEPFSRIQQGLDIFCFLLDTLPVSISAAPIVDDASQYLSSSLIDLTFNGSDHDQDQDLSQFDLIRLLLDQQHRTQPDNQ